MIDLVFSIILGLIYPVCEILVAWQIYIRKVVDGDLRRVWRHFLSFMRTIECDTHGDVLDITEQYENVKK